MNALYEKMLSAYDQRTDQARRNAIYEVSQQIVLAGLSDGGFFDKAAFYGGTCLRIFHGLNRYSEDMDFTLLKEDESFNFEQYFQPIINQFALVGRTVEITKKNKKGFGKVESVFLKDNTDVYDISFQTEKSIKIKIEVDTLPPLKFSTEQKLLLLPKSFMSRCVALPDLFAGKVHALIFRAWKNRVKGRDWYDFEWYVRNRVPLNFEHLQERIRQFNGTEMNLDEFKTALKERLSGTDINQVKADVLPFLNNPRELDIWSNDYFEQMADMIIFTKQGNNQTF
ncbi:MAG: nucleotidyl transferase AbiEii/AbiGii toxin family protein [Rikenellaceae bacterium]|nr:nucleotidyl transferase AbiEii/AbiGii toxin family protein [Rikenellaceae bacterium]